MVVSIHVAKYVTHKRKARLYSCMLIGHAYRSSTFMVSHSKRSQPTSLDTNVQMSTSLLSNPGSDIPKLNHQKDCRERVVSRGLDPSCDD